MSLRRVSRLATELTQFSGTCKITRVSLKTPTTTLPKNLEPWARRRSLHHFTGVAHINVITATRTYSASQPPTAASPVCSFSTAPSEVVFHRAADEMLGNLQDRVEQWGEEASGLDDFDFSAEAGVVTISLGEQGTYVINKQGPNKQIWMSSPFSGPLRYDFDIDKKQWVYQRDGHRLHERLVEELTRAGGGVLDLHGLNE